MATKKQRYATQFAPLKHGAEDYSNNPITLTKPGMAYGITDLLKMVAMGEDLSTLGRDPLYDGDENIDFDDVNPQNLKDLYLSDLEDLRDEIDEIMARIKPGEDDPNDNKSDANDQTIKDDKKLLDQIAQDDNSEPKIEDEK